MTSEASLGTIAKQLVDRDLCSLSPEQLAERLALIRREIQPLVVARSALPDGVAWDFENDAGTRTRLETLALLERECCGVDLEFRVEEAGTSGRLRFEIRGADVEAIRALGGEPAGSDAPGAAALGLAGLRRVAKVAGVGAATSLLVCCVIPIGIAAVAGGAIAGPLLKLDHPSVVGAVALVSAAVAWQLQRRRDAARATIAALSDRTESGCGC